MRFLLSLALFLVSIASWNAAFADCMSSAMWALPKETVEIPSNATVYVIVMGDLDYVLDVESRDAHFVSGEHTVEAVRGPVLQGKRDQTLLSFSPKTALAPGETYHLKVGNRTFTWKVGNADHVAPAWLGKPICDGFSLDQFGCGPARYFHVKYDMSEGSLFEVTLIAKDGKRQVAIVAGSKGTLLIGHGMCSGAFSVGEDEYTAKITPIDFSGNRGETRTVSLSKSQKKSR